MVNNRYGAEFENYLQEAVGTIEHDGFPNDDSCEDCDGEDCDNCSHSEDEEFTKWFHDNDDIIEYKSPICNSYEDLLKFVSEIVKKYQSSENLIMHSYGGHHGSCSMHIHMSPDKYSTYRNMYLLAIVYQILFKNSPYIDPRDNRFTMSKRHLRSHYCYLNKPASESDFIRGNINREAVAKNTHGTIEFRFNDFPKSLNQLSCAYYLQYISDKLTELKKDDILVKILENNSFPKINYLEDLNSKVQWDHIEPMTYKNLESISKSNISEYIDFIKFFSSEIMKRIGNFKVYSFYLGKHVDFKTFIETSVNYELEIFKKFKEEKWHYKVWSNFWKERFVQPIPEKLIIEND